MGVREKLMVRVFNKIGLLDRDDTECLKYEAKSMDGYSIVATVECMEDFVAVVEEFLNTLLVTIDVEILFDKGDEVNLF